MAFDSDGGSNVLDSGSWVLRNCGGWVDVGSAGGRIVEVVEGGSCGRKMEVVVEVDIEVGKDGDLVVDE